MISLKFRRSITNLFTTPSVKHFFLLCTAALLLLLTSCGASRKASSVDAPADKVADPYANFYVDFMRTDRLSEAIERAKAENKMVFIDFYTSWCLPCKLMDEDVFTDRAFGDYMNEHFVSVKINAEQGNGPNLAMLYQVQAYPTLLFIDINGKVKSRKEGAAYQTELRRMGAEALSSNL
jgi:thiol:disulfide interchange protein